MRRLRALVAAIQNNDEQQIEDAVLRLSQSKRWLAPLALAVGGVVLLFDALRLLITHWRLTLVQILPAMWIWLAMFDLKLHVLHGRTFHVLRGPILIPIIAGVTAITIAAFFLNAVFALAVAERPAREVRPVIHQARGHLRMIVISGTVVGVLLGFATTVVPRWGHPWFAIVLSLVVGVMMLAYVAVPARMIGVPPPRRSRRDKLTTSALGGAIGATICTPPYVMGRIGILMLGTRSLFIPGIVLLSLGATLQAGATGAAQAIKVSVRLAMTGEQSYVPGDEPDAKAIDADATLHRTRRN